MQSADQLRTILSRIDGRGYKAYREIRGDFEFASCTVCVDHVQGDPFATPSKLRVRVPQHRAGIPLELFDNAVRRMACEDFLARRVRRAIRRMSTGGRERRGSGRSGAITVDAGGQEVLQRTAVVLTPDWVEARIQLGLPAAGRRILGKEAKELLCDDLPRIAEESLCELSLDDARQFVDCIENQEHIRSGLAAHGLVAFVGDGAFLPRESGVSDRPLERAETVPFQSPAELRVELPLLHPIEIDGARRETLSGLGVRRGVTLIVGGGYHGKSTLLRAIERGVYPHIPGDGREWVVSEASLVKIRAEDGRRVEQVDIGAFIDQLPGGRSTHAFDSDDASGSTSQAANIVEALEAGATGLLLDEDTSATNFMVRDARMQALIHKDHEPITPFVERVKEIHDTLGVSTVLVMGGCGDYFETADTVIALREYRPIDVTAQAKEIAVQSGGSRRHEALSPLASVTERIPFADSFDPSRGRREVKIDTRAVDEIGFGREKIDLRGAEQLVDWSQTRAIGCGIHLAARRFMDGSRTLGEVLDRLDELFDQSGLDELDPFYQRARHPGNFARPRRFEVAAAINRLRSVRMKQRRSDS